MPDWSPIKTKKKIKWIWWLLAGFIFLICLIFLLIVISEEDVSYSDDYTTPENTVTTNDTSEVISQFNAVEEVMREYSGQELDLSGTTSASAVNVICPYAGEEMSFESDGEGGSGVVIHSDGIIITNSHVIPQDEELLDVNEEGCLVLFPDIDTGLPMQAYYADPVVIPGLSDEYDLAMLIITEVYQDKYGNEYGRFPNTFPAVSDEVCQEENIRLGEGVTVYGYPGVTGGYSLTVTEGVVSSFSPNGIVISAKIDLGNSGGLAVDDYGCFMGVPTLVNYGEAESYGIIVPASDVGDFLNEAVALMEEES